MPARIRLAQPLGLDSCAVDQVVQRTLRHPMRDAHGKGFMAAAQGAEVGHIRVKANQPQQALEEADRLPQRHFEEDLHRPAGLDRSIAVEGCRPRLPVGFAAKTTSGSNQIASTPWGLSAVSYSGQFRAF
jgi:hypothetical protein